MTKYFSFQGLAKRQEYWATTLLTFFVGWMVYVISILFAGIVAFASPLTGGIFIVLLTLAWIFGSFWLVLATTVRRCRDADIHVLWVLLWFVPFINFWWWIIAGCLPSVDKNFIPNDKT
jgi:uncharacterized membrane protein YhaH (DUF805 family)